VDRDKQWRQTTNACSSSNVKRIVAAIRSPPVSLAAHLGWLVGWWWPADAALAGCSLQLPHQVGGQIGTWAENQQPHALGQGGSIPSHQRHDLMTSPSRNSYFTRMLEQSEPMCPTKREISGKTIDLPSHLISPRSDPLHPAGSGRAMAVCQRRISIPILSPQRCRCVMIESELPERTQR